MDLGEYGEITSVVVSRGGSIVTEVYLDGDASVLRNTRSCTKTVLGMLVGIAIDRGVLPGVDVSVETLLPDRTASLYPDRAGVVLLGVALERALGEQLSEFARRELFDPIGVGPFDWPRTPLGETSTAGGLLLTPQGLLALGRLYLCGSHGLVPETWVFSSTEPHAQIAPETSYGYLWWLREFAGHRSYYMSGTGGNRVHVVPDLDLVAVITSRNFHRRDAHELSDRLLVEQVLAEADSQEYTYRSPEGPRRPYQSTKLDR